MNKTSVATLYLYTFLFTLSAWLCDVTFTADRSCTLVGCDTTLHTVHYKHTTSNAHSTLWHSYTDDHRGQLIVDVISYPDPHNTHTPTRLPNTTHYNKQLHQIRCLTHYTTGHRGQLNTQYHQTTYPTSDNQHTT